MKFATLTTVFVLLGTTYAGVVVDKVKLGTECNRAIGASVKLIDSLTTLTSMIEVNLKELPKIDPTTVPGHIAYENFESTVAQVEVYLKKFQEASFISTDQDWKQKKDALKARAEKALNQTSIIIDEMRELTGMLEIDVQELPKLDANTVAGRIQLNTIQNTVAQLDEYLKKLQP